MIHFNELSIGYSEFDSVQVKFDQLSTGLIFLVGGNGSGKSTFLKTIFGEIKPINGNIKVDQMSVSDAKSIQRAQKIAFLSTSTTQVDYLTVRKYIELGSTPYLNTFGKPNTIEQNNSTFDQQFNLEKFYHKFLNELSDGEKQLVSISKVLTQNTAVYLLDEPTSFLDPKNKRALFNFLRDYAQNFNKTIIISTHDIEVALPYADGILYINNKSMSFENNMDLKSILDIY